MAPDSSRGELREGICSFSPNEEQIAVPSPGSGLMVPSQRARRVTGEEQTGRAEPPGAHSAGTGAGTGKPQCQPSLRDENRISPAPNHCNSFPPASSPSSQLTPPWLDGFGSGHRGCGRAVEKRLLQADSSFREFGSHTARPLHCSKALQCLTDFPGSKSQSLVIPY